MRAVVACLMVLAVGCDEAETRSARFVLQWGIENNGVTQTCEDVGGATVTATSDGNQAFLSEFPCDDLVGTSVDHVPGTYSVTVAMLDGSGAEISSFQPVSVELRDGDSDDLGEFTFELGRVCDASTCPNGCCDELGTCVDPQSDAACGRGGATCTDCTGLAQVCNATEGMCID